MATNNFIKKITPLDSEVTYTINDPILNEVIVGTQTASTGSWTGKSNTIYALYNGLQIRYYLPWAGSGNAQLNLTLADNTTTGNIPIYYRNNDRLTTHYSKGSVITLTYFAAGAIKIDGTATSDARWICDPMYPDGNEYAAVEQSYSQPSSGTNGVMQYSLFARTGENKYDSFTTTGGTGTSKAKTTLAYDITKIYYANRGSNLAANTAFGTWQFRQAHRNVDLRYSLNITTTTLTQNKPIYIVFNEQSVNGMHTLADTWWSQTLPSEEDGLIYVQVGFVRANSSQYYTDLPIINQAFIYKQGAIRLYSDIGNLEVSGRMTMNNGKPINQILVGTGTAATSSNGTYYPAKWTFNTGANVKDGDIYTIRIPVAGHDYGVFMSVNNGTNYYPIVCSGTGRLTTHYPVNTYIQVVFEASGSAASMFALAGGTGRVTVSGGAFRVINYYADGNNYNWVRPYYIYWKTKTALYRYQLLFTQNEQYLLPANAVNNSQATTKTLTTESFDPFGDIYYYGSTTTVNADARIGDNTLYSMNGIIDLRYSFNTGTTLTSQKGVYLVMVPQSDGKVKLHSTPITQTLPTTEDGLVYKYLGQAYSNYGLQLVQEKPCYCFKNGALRPWTGPAITQTLNFTTGATITGDGSTLSFPVSHELATMDVMVQVYDLSTYETVEVDITRTSNSIVTVTFASAPANGATYRVLLLNMNTNTITDLDSTLANTSTITGNGSTTSFPISHSFGSRDVVVQIYDTASYDTVQCDAVRTDVNTVTITFPTAPASGKAYRVMLLNAS